MNKVISVENLGKKYIISHKGSANTTFREMLTENAKKILKGKLFKNSSKEEFWALRNVSFKINQGERVGIIGRNGAGKTTLLKLLSRITEPSEGRIKIKGRVASLLEVGTGFHPELTGRENIYLNGAVLGMTRSEIKKKFDDIVDFSGVEKFLDTPVKRFSSGMYVRLAFAVAAHLEPDILLVDEVLAVGDVEFQKKSLGKMEEVSTNEGRTVLFVSHNLGAVSRLCNYCIWINSGKISEIGSCEKVISDYLNVNKKFNGQIIWDIKEDAPGDKDYIYVKSLKIINSKGEITKTVFSEEPFWIEIEYEVLKDLPLSQIGIKLNSDNGEIIFQSGDNNLLNPQIINRSPGRYLSRCLIPSYLLNQGNFSISLYGHIPGMKFLINNSNEPVMNFEVLLKHSTDGYGKLPGIIKPLLEWKIKRLN